MDAATARSVADDIARLITLGRDGRAAIAAGPDDHVIGSVEIEIEDGETERPVARPLPASRRQAATLRSSCRSAVTSTR